MRALILDKASDLFLSYGFKSVTMDELAESLGMSKKTIYAHFDNKSKLVEAATFHVFDKICSGIQSIVDEDRNPIEELFAIKTYAIKNLKDEKSSPQHQLQKYYPKIYRKLVERQYEFMREFVVCNLKKGIELGLFRQELDVSFISRLYFMGMVGIKNTELFPRAAGNMDELITDYLDYHLRAIVTPRGLEMLKECLAKQLKK